MPEAITFQIPWRIECLDQQSLRWEPYIDYELDSIDSFWIESKF